MTENNPSKSIVVAGDVCLDVVGIEMPPRPASEHHVDNWRQTGETQTRHLPGGAMLLKSMIEEAAKSWNVEGMVPGLPDALGELKRTKRARRSRSQFNSFLTMQAG